MPEVDDIDVGIGEKAFRRLIEQHEGHIAEFLMFRRAYQKVHAG